VRGNGVTTTKKAWTSLHILVLMRISNIEFCWVIYSSCRFSSVISTSKRHSPMQGTETVESQFIAVVVQKQKTSQNPLRFPFKTLQQFFSCLSFLSFSTRFDFYFHFPGNPLNWTYCTSGWRSLYKLLNVPNIYILYTSGSYHPHPTYSLWAGNTHNGNLCWQTIGRTVKKLATVVDITLKETVQ